MAALPKLPWNVRLGSIGESAIKTRLAYFSNPTKYEIDQGIDFYCELIANDSPSKPFYIQAKGTEHFDENWRGSIEKTTVTYWLQQEFPVFLVVYDEPARKCYWMSIEAIRHTLAEKVIETNADSISFVVDRSNELYEGKDRNNALIAKINWDLALVRLNRGNPQFIGDGYVKRIPLLPRNEVELQRTKQNLRANMYSLVQHFMDMPDLPEAWKYLEFLADFDKGHYNHFLWRGRVAKAMGKTDIARESFLDALKICDADKVWPAASMAPIIACINAELEQL